MSPSHLTHDSGHPAHHRAGLLQISLAGALWGTGGLAVQLIREHVPMSVLTISAWRMLLAALVLGAVLLLLSRGGEVVALVRADGRHAALVGAATASYQALYFASVVSVGVTVSTVVSLGLAPVLLTAAEALQRRRLPRATQLLVLAAALVGLVLVAVSAGTDRTGPHPVLGVLAAVGSGAAYAVTTVVGRPLAQRTTPLVLTTATTSVGALVLLPFGLLAALLGDGTLASGDPTVVAWVLYLGLFTMALPYGLLYAGLRTTPGSSAVVATLLEPVTAAYVAWLFLDEQVGPAGLVGAGLILLAVASLGRRPATVPPG